MSDEKSRPKDGVDNTFGGKDPRVIEIDDPTERAYWLKALDISEEKLRAAIEAVGPFAQKVRDYLKQSK